MTIQNGKMTDIAVLDASGEDKPYYKQALPLLDEMLAVQSAEVDTVSGATLTAEGLIGAVENALGKAADDGKTQASFNSGAAASAGQKAPYMAAHRGAVVLLCVHAGRIRGRVFRGKTDLSAHWCRRGALCGQLHTFPAGAVRLHPAFRPFFLWVRLRLRQLGRCRLGAFRAYSKKSCSTAKSSSVCRSGRCFWGRRSNICCWHGW